MSITTQRPGQRDHGANEQRSRNEARASVIMLAVFVPWTIGFILLSGWLSGAKGGEVGYIRAWLPWLGVTTLWVLPLLAGLGLGLHARRRAGGRLALIGIWFNAVALAVVTLPSLADRLISG
jgi:hypothetical protein